MKIQLRILILLGVVFVAGLAVLAAVLFAVVTPAFEQLDREQAGKNISRVAQSFENELAVLDQKVVDWSHWNDTYAFVLDGSPEYIEVNLQPISLINLNVSFMAFYDITGKTIWAGGYDPATEKAKDFSALTDAARLAPVIVGRKGQLHGLLVLDGRNFLMSAGDIVDSDGNGPSHGTLMIGREIDDALLQDLKARTEVNFHVQPHQPAASDTASDTAARSDEPRLIAQTGDMLTHRVILRDIDYTPKLDIDIETHRDASIIGRSSVDIAAVLLIGTVLLIMAVIAIAINVLVVHPIRRINIAMQDVAKSADLEKRLGWTRRDELGILARQFDYMLEQIAHARRDLLELTFKIGRSDLATGMFHNVRNAMSPLANQLHRAAANLAPAGDGHVEQAFAELKDADTDPTRKARLVDFLSAAWSQGAAQQQTVRREIDAANGQLAAIEQILNQQHDQGEVISTESLALSFLISESLNFFGVGQLAVANIEVEASVAAMPPVAVQRLPMIHVLYNIIANAITAIEANAGTPGRVVMRAIQESEKSAIRLEIVDNGIGVEITSLTDIFRPGYTTKTDKKGGEGLHWCANTMAACGGRIWAESAGSGAGMTILIEIPQAMVPR